MKKIILLTDFSNNAQKAIDYALALFERKNAVFYILHAFDNGLLVSRNKSKAKSKLKRLVANLRERYKKDHHTFEGQLLTDTTLRSVKNTVVEKDIDLVFMGTKGASDLGTVLWGSNTVYTIRHFNACPIVAVPASYEFNPPEEIVFVNDYKSQVRSQELKPLTDITKLWESTLVIVHVESEKGLTKTQKLNKDTLRKNLETVKHRFVHETMRFSVSSTVKQLQLENKHIGMVALVKNNYGFFEKLVRKPVIRNIAFTTEIPLLVLPPIAE